MRYLCIHCGTGGASFHDNPRPPASYHCHVCKERDAMYPAPVVERLQRVTKQRDQLYGALRLALNSHGTMLMSDPPQDPWKVHKVEEIGRAALRQVSENSHE